MIPSENNADYFKVFYVNDFIDKSINKPVILDTVERSVSPCICFLNFTHLQKTDNYSVFLTRPNCS